MRAHEIDFSSGIRVQRERLCTRSSLKSVFTHTQRYCVYNTCIICMRVCMYFRGTRTPHKFDASNSWVLIRLVSPHPVRVIVFFFFFLFARVSHQLYITLQCAHIYRTYMDFPKSMSEHEQ